MSDNNENIDNLKTKDTSKNTNIKEDAIATENLLIDFFKNPISTINKIYNFNDNKFFNYSIILLITWILIIFINYIFSNNIFNLLSINSILSNSASFLLGIAKNIIQPIAIVLVLTTILFIMCKNEKKSFKSIFSIVTFASIPKIIASIAFILTIISNNMTLYSILSSFSSFCYMISIILYYFVIKTTFNYENDLKLFKSFTVIIGIFYIAKFILSLLGITIY